MRVLFISSAPRSRTLATEAISTLGALELAKDFAEGLEKFSLQPAEIVVVDIHSHRDDLVGTLGALRARNAPSRILVITARDMVGQRIQALEHGADDDLLRPFASAELRARVVALSRRPVHHVTLQLRAGDVEVDTQRRSVKRSGRPLNLAAREYRLLEYFVRRQGQMITRLDVEAHLYDSSRDLNSNVVDSSVCSLRKKLNAHGGSNLIQTRRGFGYIFNA